MINRKRGVLSKNDLLKEFRQDFNREWKNNYRYQGIIAFLRCLAGTSQIIGTNKFVENPGHELECITFSVIPEISSLWVRFINQALSDINHRVLIGDCSGNFLYQANPKVNIFPLFNFNHGVKLDLFMQHVCSAEYVLVCDDDLFWLDDEPLRWALESFQNKENLAVVSLYPRPHKIPQLKEVVHEAMGSYCLVIRRKTWINEQLSFKYYRPPNWQKIGNFFDTADYANLQLVQRGYLIESPPNEIRSHLIPFYGTSMWGLKILRSKGNIVKMVNPRRPDEYKKAYRTTLALLGFHELIKDKREPSKILIDPNYLIKAKGVAADHLDRRIKLDVESVIYEKLENLERHISSAENKRI
jgi:hypothetical protein